MRLTQRTDYALRVLMHLSVRPGVTRVGEIADRFRISENHVMKVAQELARAGWVVAQRGRGGGLRLAVEPGAIKVGDVVRRFEPDFQLVECFDPVENECVVTKACGLRMTLHQALDLFFERLDGVTLADVTANQAPLAGLLRIEPLDATARATQ